LFCFGSGTNAENIIKYFAWSGTVVVFYKQPTAKVIERKNNKIRTEIFFERRTEVKYYKKKSIGPDLIVLAGFY
jgi:phosphoribosylglycinamide formyltransferase-1